MENKPNKRTGRLFVASDSDLVLQIYLVLQIQPVLFRKNLLNAQDASTVNPGMQACKNNSKKVKSKHKMDCNDQFASDELELNTWHNPQCQTSYRFIFSPIRPWRSRAVCPCCWSTRHRDRRGPSRWLGRRTRSRWISGGDTRPPLDRRPCCICNKTLLQRSEMWIISLHFYCKSIINYIIELGIDCSYYSYQWQKFKKNEEHIICFNSIITVMLCDYVESIEQIVSL